MPDLGQILLLPPPQPQIQRLPVSSTGGREQDLAVNPDALAAETARARRFRFRIHEGGESAETGTDLATRQTGNRAARNNERSAGDATGQPSQGRIRYATPESRAGNSSAFLTQAFAQEQLGEGLHNPPFAAATAAYSRTGAALTARGSAGVNISV